MSKFINENISQDEYSCICDILKDEERDINSLDEDIAKELEEAENISEIIDILNSWYSLSLIYHKDEKEAMTDRVNDCYSISDTLQPYIDYDQLIKDYETTFTIYQIDNNSIVERG